MMAWSDRAGPGPVVRPHKRAGSGQNGWAVPLRLRRGEQPGREVRRGGRSSTPNRYARV